MRQKNLFNGVWDMPYGRTTPYHLFDAAKNSREFVQKLQLQRKIPVHEGCVNSICWNSNGKYLLSGSDDQRLSIVHGYDYSVLAYIQTGHRANIFSAKFLPNTGDSHVVSCSGDGIIIFSDLERPNTSLTNKFTCHRGTAYEIMTVPNDSHTFLSCGEDRSVRWFDVRTKTSCSKDDCKEDILIHCQSPVTSLAVNPLTPYQLAVGCADASVRIFDRRMLCTYNTSGFSSGNSMGLQALMTCFTVPEFTQSRRITSLCYSGDGQEMLVSYSSDYIYLFDIKDDLDKKPKILSKEGTSKESDDYYPEVFVPGRPLMKRLRIRGDWSDTGPNARPEAEAREMEEGSSRSRIVRTMTNIMSRVFSNLESRTRSDVSQSSSASSDGDADPAADTSATGEQAPVGSAAWRSRRRAMRSQASEEPTSKRRGRSDNPADSTNEPSASKSKCSKITDPNTPSTSSAYVEGRLAASTSDEAPGPSTSAEDTCSRVSVYKVDKEKNVNKKKLKDPKDYSHLAVEKELQSKRNDLVEKHDAEPMVSCHYSGQGVSSGQITVDVASSSTANERQWLEQTASDLPELPSDLVPQEAEADTPEASPAQEDPASPSESEVEAGMESIQPNQDLLPLISNIGSMANSSGSSVQAESSGEAEDGEVELMMEVDSWEDMDSEEENNRPSSISQGPSRSRRSSERVSSNFMDSLSDELRKVENHMPTVTQPRVKKKFTGHRNARTMIKESTFWGDNFIMSGSDCGHIFIWDRHTTELVMLMEADHHVVNCLQPHPFDPILASSGIDYDIKLWAPSREEPFFDQEKANEIIKRNEIMLEETKDTITVPASFMFRVFSTINNIRRDRRLGLLGRDMWTANSEGTDP